MANSGQEMYNEEAMDLRQWLRTVVPKRRDKGFSFLDNSLASYLIQFQGMNMASAEALTATLFWQIYLSSVFPNLINQNTGFGYRPEVPEIIIIPDGNGSFTPVLFDKEVNDIQMFYARDGFPVADFESWSDAIFTWKGRTIDKLLRYREYRAKYFRQSPTEQYMDILEGINPEFIIQILNKLDDVIVFAPGMDLIETACTCPSPGHQVTLEDGGTCIATVGIFAENRRRLRGATIPYHAVRDLLKHNKYNSDQVRIYIEGNEYEIYSQDIVSDSCFVIPVNGKCVDSFNPRIKPLSGILPRSQEDVFFEGCRSGKKEAFITGWTPDLPMVNPECQLRIFTNAVTNPGDSGAALRNEEGYVLGFAFQRSGLKQKMQTSSWIWADSVFQAHDLVQ